MGGVTLLPPVAVKDSVSPPPSSLERLPPTSAPMVDNPVRPILPVPVVASPMSLRQAIEQVRGGNSQFRQLRAEVREGGTIWVYDDPWRGEAVTAFARALQQIPGVRGVLIKSSSLLP